MEEILITVIIDDDKIATEQLKREISSYKRLHFVGNAFCGSDGRALILNSDPDLIFLDVEMPDCTGFEFLRSVRGLLKSDCHVVFYTAYNKYMIDALREKAFDFLLKPLDTQEVSKVVSRVLMESSSKSSSDGTDDTLILNTVLGEMIVVNPDDISFFSYDEARRCWTAVLTSGKNYVLRRSTKSDKILTFSNLYLQVEKRHIINKHQLASVVNGHCVMQPPLDKIDDILISSSKLAELKNCFLNL